MGINTDSYNSYYYNNQYATNAELMDARQQNGSIGQPKEMNDQLGRQDSLSLFQSLD
jgi:hypothetical protein